VKDDGEVARIEAACRIADDALAAVRPRLWDGLTEADFARALESAMFERGAEALSFSTIVGSGPNGALPHHDAARRRIEPGDLVVVDFGAMVDGYHSDMTRTFVVGEPTADQARLLTAVTEAQAAGAAAVAPGVATTDVDARCREVLDGYGLGELFHHGTGHGVGLVIHEAPMLGRTSTGVLEAGNVITVEPGVYVAGLGGVRVEDTLAVTADGARPLTSFPKDPRCLPSAPTTSRPA
jgi:Xaa-Pro aminopeptidase